MSKILLISLALFVLVNCDDCSDSFSCTEDRLVKSLDEYEQNGSAGDFFELVKIKDSPKGRSAEDNIVDRSIRFLQEHELRLRIPEAEGRSLGLENRSNKLRKILLPILLILKLKAAIILPIILSVIGLVAFKGLGAGLVALTIAGATGLKSLLENHGGGHSKISYEIVPQLAAPQWSRSSLDQNMDLAYPTMV